jgi:hypothetical protein
MPCSGRWESRVAEMALTTSRWQLPRREAWWAGSRGRIHDPSDTNGIRGRAVRASRHRSAKPVVIEGPSGKCGGVGRRWRGLSWAVSAGCPRCPVPLVRGWCGTACPSGCRPPRRSQQGPVLPAGDRPCGRAEVAGGATCCSVRGWVVALARVAPNCHKYQSLANVRPMSRSHKAVIQAFYSYSGRSRLEPGNWVATTTGESPHSAKCEQGPPGNSLCDAVSARAYENAHKRVR